MLAPNKFQTKSTRIFSWGNNIVIQKKKHLEFGCKSLGCSSIAALDHCGPELNSLNKLVLEKIKPRALKLVPGIKEGICIGRLWKSKTLELVGPHMASISQKEDKSLIILILILYFFLHCFFLSNQSREGCNKIYTKNI